MSRAVWPDWATFESSSEKIAYKCSPKWLVTFGLFKKTNLSKNCCEYYLGNIRKHLGKFYYNTWSHWTHKPRQAHYELSVSKRVLIHTHVTRLGDLLDFGQLF